MLRAAEFAGLPWDEASPHVPLADVLRVHDWPYVRKLQARICTLSRQASSDPVILCAACWTLRRLELQLRILPLAADGHVGFDAQAAAAALPDGGLGSIGHLDGDTAISQGSFGAALAAAGAVCRAVDTVLGGQVCEDGMGSQPSLYDPSLRLCEQHCIF